MTANVLIVGAGVTGSLCASLIRCLAAQKDVSISILEKSRGAGGRMSTSRCCLSEDESQVGYVDLGAQYISVKPEYTEKHARFIDELLDANVLVPFTGTIDGLQAKFSNTKNYVAPKGMSSIAKFYLEQSGVKVKYGNQVIGVDMNVPDKMCSVYTVDGATELCHALVLTMPVPQILNLKGNINSFIDSSGQKQKLQDVSYSSRYALGLFFGRGAHLDVPWSMKYCEDPVIRYVAIDNKKRQDGNGCLSICAHTSVPYGIANLDRDTCEVKNELLARLKNIIPSLPEHEEVKIHKWRYSQVLNAFSGSPGCIRISDDPLVVLAGDAFVHSNYNGCVESAVKASQVLNSCL